MTIDPIMREPAVCAAVGLSRATIRRMEQRGDFPARMHLSECAVGWRTSVIAAWIEARTPADVAA